MNAARPVTVIGAGFSGLSAAYCLQLAGYDVEVLEHGRIGGLIATERTPWGLVETAASGALNTARFEALARDLGVQLLCPGPRARKRYIYRDRPSRFPLHAAEMPAIVSLLARFVTSRASLAPHAEESVRAWATRVASPAVSHYLVEGALQGIYSGNPERLSASVILGRFFAPRAREPRAKHGGIVAPPGGMGQIIDALHAMLVQRGVRFVDEAARAYDRTPERPQVVATGAASAAMLLEVAEPQLAQALRSFDLSTLVTCTLFFREKCLEGFGCLFPPIEQRRALGVLINTDIFPNRSAQYVSETWILGGATGASAVNASDLLQLSDGALVDLAVEERKAAFGKSGRPVGFRVTRWPHTIPHYTIELERALPRLQRGGDNVFLHGNYMGHIGLAKILERAAALPAQIAERGHW
jgi:oxygen-dependent protoporphyrinogen oxidase